MRFTEHFCAGGGQREIEWATVLSVIDLSNKMLRYSCPTVVEEGWGEAGPDFDSVMINHSSYSKNAGEDEGCVRMTIVKNSV